MRVERLELTNFRGIRHLALDFPTQTTVLVGINGVGKSAVLDAIALLMEWAFERILEDLELQRVRHTLDARDVRIGARGWKLTITAREGDQTFTWGESAGQLPEGEPELSGEPDPYGRFLWGKTRERPRPAPPLVVQYSTSRGQWLSAPRDSEEELPAEEWKRAFHGALPAGVGTFDDFYTWFREREDLENEERARRQQDHRDRQLEAVRGAISTLLGGFSHLRIERRQQRMAIQKQDETLDVMQLSSGEKALLTLVGDLSRRLSLLNPDLEEPRLGNGLVLIDEVDLHLHPRWQRTIIADLERTFPNCQFIVTTHSPQVLSEVKPESIYLLERRNGDTVAARPGASFGLDSNRILEDLMGVDERPRCIKERLQELFRLIDEGKLEEARAVRGELAEEIGSDEPNFAKADVLIRRKELLPGAPHRPKR
ncbi:AAA family ATPase [Myxococcus sp. RHSTA-1-4]|uniref:AAA family ATPase n=1 Tax=Myxococcus sp. RHSTA-1-4 TaxID=2874601 RepID=UPI001CBF3C90|nr:AAA family ATPase [Myxococcus sp. RHSTA-1-4]MBZ4417558.1 AAA family ATPase [Myxococcus sp. RHSTA-1-4]